MKFIYFLLFGLLSVNLSAQGISVIPNQYFANGSYPFLDLDNSVNYTGCYNFELSLLSVVGGVDDHPNLPEIEYDDFRENMTATIKIQYAGFDLAAHPDDKMWVFDEEERLVEVNVPHSDPFSLDGQLLFLNIKGNFDFYQTKLVYYSGDLDKHFTIENAFEYRSNKIMGSPLEPYVIDVAPLIFELNSDNEVLTTIVDSTYSGGICLSVDLLDCDGTLFDTDSYCYESIGEPCLQNLVVTQAMADMHMGGDTKLKASQTITSSAQLSGTGKVKFSGKECITLEPGFSVPVGLEFRISLNGCN